MVLGKNNPLDERVRKSKFWFFRLRLAISRRLGRNMLSNDIKKERIIISPGGVATTFLIEYLSRFETVNDKNDIDGLKHLPYIPVDFHGKIIFISGAPKEITSSLVRRDFQGIQAAKLGCVLCQFCWGALQRKLLIRAVENQIRIFKKRKDKNILFINYEDIWTKKEDIASHFGIHDESFCRNFPSRKQRTSSVS